MVEHTDEIHRLADELANAIDASRNAKRLLKEAKAAVKSAKKDKKRARKALIAAQSAAELKDSSNESPPVPLETLNTADRDKSKVDIVGASGGKRSKQSKLSHRVGRISGSKPVRIVGPDSDASTPEDAAD